MTYFPMGEIDTAKFNSTKYPGTCKPMDFDTLNIVREMQGQLNRLAKARGRTLIAVDGDVGPGTVAAVRAAAGDLSPLQFDTSSCMAVATRSLDIGMRAKTVADGLGAPAKVPSPIPPKAPSIVTITGAEIKAPPMAGASLIDSVKNLGMPMLLLLGVGVVGVGYYVTKKAK